MALRFRFNDSDKEMDASPECMDYSSRLECDDCGKENTTFRWCLSCCTALCSDCALDKHQSHVDKIRKYRSFQRDYMASLTEKIQILDGTVS